MPSSKLSAVPYQASYDIDFSEHNIRQTKNLTENIPKFIKQNLQNERDKLKSEEHKNEAAKLEKSR